MYKKLLFLLFCFGIFANLCFARYSTIMDATSGNEPSLYQVLDRVAPLSRGWGETADLNMNTSGRRVDDNADQLWQTEIMKVSVICSFWGGTAYPSDTTNHYFCYDDNLDGSSPSVNSFTINSNGPFIIGADGGIYGAWSKETLNKGPLSDRAVTFDVRGLDIYTWTDVNLINPETSLLTSSAGSRYIVAFETGKDGDYQDMLVLVEAKPVPEPGAIVLSCCGLIFANWLRHKRLVN